MPDAGTATEVQGSQTYGAANLANSYAFDLPKGGSIYEWCEQTGNPGIPDLYSSQLELTFANVYVSAVRVAKLKLG